MSGLAMSHEPGSMCDDLFLIDAQARLAPRPLSGGRFIDGDIFFHGYSAAYKLYICHFASSLCCFHSFHNFAVEK
jgi:hypothetical protein